MFKKKVVWHQAPISYSDFSQFPNNKILRQEVNLKDLCFVRNEGELFAFAEKCPHQGVSLVNGFCEKGEVICPWHKYVFSLKSGKNTSHGGNALRVYPTKVENDKIYVGFEKISLF